MNYERPLARPPAESRTSQPFDSLEKPTDIFGHLHQNFPDRINVMSTRCVFASNSHGASPLKSLINGVSI